MTDDEVVAEVSCGFCMAAKGEPCKDTRTGRLTRRPHPSRRRDAGFQRVGEHPGEMPVDRYDRDY